MNFSVGNGIGHEPYICMQNEKVEAVNDSFTAMTGYKIEELKGKAILHVLNDILKLSKKLNSIDELKNVNSYFLFNKMLDFREARIMLKKDFYTDILYVEFEQLPLININNPLGYTHQLISDNFIGIAIYSADDYTLLKASKEYERIMFERYFQTNIVGKKVYEFILSWGHSLARPEWQLVIDNKKAIVNMEQPIKNPITGEMEYFDTSIAPIIDEDRVKFLVIALNDVTEKVNYRKENEKKALLIEKQNELLETVIQEQQDSIFIIDKIGNIILNNKDNDEKFAQQLFTTSDLYNCSEYYSEDGKRLRFEEMPIQRVISGEKINDFKLKLKRGDFTKYLSINGTPIYDKNGNFEYALMFGHDMTEIVESRQLIINQKEQLEAVMENMSDAIFIIDSNGKYILQNKAAIEGFGTEIKQVGDFLKITKCFEMDGEEIPYDNMPEVLMQRGIETRDRVIHIKFPDHEVYVSVSATPLLDENGNFTIGVLSSRDITEYIKRNETIKKQHIALLKAEKKEKENLEKMIAMKDEFLSLISHEFKTPLTVINSALQVMDFLYKDQITDKIKVYLDKIKQNTFRQVRLVNNLLDITGANAGHIKLNMRNLDVIYITSMIVDSVKLYANQKGVNVHFVTDIKEKVIALDEEKYERILLNLLSNAIKFSAVGKNITVRINCQRKNINISVIDEGIGIPIEKHELIFERFGQVDSSYTRQAEGSGIGLSLVRLMVNAMGGHISVESKVGVGSTFTVSLSDRVLEDKTNTEALIDSIDSRLVQSIAIEFSDIYF